MCCHMFPILCWWRRGVGRAFPVATSKIRRGFFSNLFSFFKPILKKGAKELVSVASRVASDAIEGQNVKESLKKHALSGVSNLLQNNPTPEPKVQISKKLTPASARRKIQKIVKHSVSGKGTKRKHLSLDFESKKVEKKKKQKNVHFPILDLM